MRTVVCIHPRYVTCSLSGLSLSVEIVGSDDCEGVFPICYARFVSWQNVMTFVGECFHGSICANMHASICAVFIYTVKREK